MSPSIGCGFVQVSGGIAPSNSIPKVPKAVVNVFEGKCQVILFVCYMYVLYVRLCYCLSMLIYLFTCMFTDVFLGLFVYVLDADASNSGNLGVLCKAINE